MSGSRGNLVFRAGREAFAVIREEGLDATRIGSLAGASGGAKWLVLSQLDRAVIASLLPKLTGQVYTIGTSIGAWRFACYAQPDPLAAIDRFEEAYIDQSYSAKPDREEITQKSQAILDHVLNDASTAEVLSHPVLRTNIMTVRGRHLLASESTPVLAAGLAATAGLNAVSRRSLGLFFERALFFDARSEPPFFAVDGFPMQRVSLDADNLKPAILATGSIPLVLNGVRNIAGARPGVYRDGGVIDYHLDLPTTAENRLTLYLHFYDFLKPGWFDKRLRWRHASPDNTARTLLISPSKEFVARLPYGKIPDRHDFVRLPPRDRVRAWRQVVRECEALADELLTVIDTGALAERLEPL